MSETKKIYVAGPMRYFPEFNFPAFAAATATLREAGWEVFSPAERDLEHGFDPTGLEGSDAELAELDFDLRAALGADTAWICQHADAIYLLPNWEKSSGAVAERALGEALGLEIIEEQPCFEKATVKDAVIVGAAMKTSFAPVSVIGQDAAVASSQQ